MVSLLKPSKPTGGFGPQPRSIMKITFTKKEIEEIILNHVNREIYEDFSNEMRFDRYDDENFVTIKSAEPVIEEPSDET
jgi:hypothetical protein